MEHAPIRLVIFDFDGTVADTETLWAQAISELTRSWHNKLTGREARDCFIGLTVEQTLSRLAEIYGRNLPGGAARELEERFRRLCDAELKPNLGVVEVLQCLSKSGVSVCIASNGDRQSIREMLARMAISEYFRGVFTVEDVDRPKPAPDVFLHAARETGVDPGGCLVIEDSATGIIGAVEAGMMVLGYSPEKHLSHEAIQELGAIPISHMNEVRARLIDRSPQLTRVLEHSLRMIF